MKFSVATATDIYGNKKDNKGRIEKEYLEDYNKVHETLAKYGTKINKMYYEIELNTLEELMQFLKDVEYEVAINCRGGMEIIDDYRE